jgi:hypothetical protein
VGMKVCGINKLSQAAPRSNEQCSCATKQCNEKANGESHMIRRALLNTEQQRSDQWHGSEGTPADVKVWQMVQNKTNATRHPFSLIPNDIQYVSPILVRTPWPKSMRELN